MTAFTLSLIESTVGNPLRLPEIMQLDLRNAENELISGVTVVVGKASLTVAMQDIKDASRVPHCNGMIHLTASVTTALMTNFTADHELIHDVFTCETTGDAKTLPLTL
ncbi:hypothetical protein [Halomonas sp. BMC6]|uniref:hypothetical protein n=1 Tax=Halomonas sp. BMC6 TaxID=3073244 RepID=UPI0030CA764D